jgi:hypothetical protein
MRLSLVLAISVLATACVGCGSAAMKGNVNGDAAPSGVETGADVGSPGGSGGATGGTSGIGGTGGSAGSAGTGGGGTAGGTYADGCPPALPSAGPCAPAGRLCTYGSAPREECRDRATCMDGQWVVKPGTCPAPAQPSACPDAAPKMGPPGCTANLLCRYADGTECQCLDNAALHMTMWICNVPQMGSPQCPLTPPNAGTTCDSPGKTCSYGCGPLSAKSVTTMCGTSGVWNYAETACSPSGG